MFSPNFFQAFQLRVLKQGNKHRLAHHTTMAPNRLLRAKTRELRNRLTVCLKPRRKELLQAEITELNPVAELWGVYEPDR